MPRYRNRFSVSTGFAAQRPEALTDVDEFVVYPEWLSVGRPTTDRFFARCFEGEDGASLDQVDRTR